MRRYSRGRYSRRRRSRGRYVSGYSAHGYSRNTFYIYIGIAAVALLVALGLMVGYFVKANKERKENQLIYRQEGISFYEKGEYEKALNCFEKALENSKDSMNEVEMDICFYKAITQYELGDAEGARDTYDAVIEYNDDPQAYFLRGNLYYSMEEEAKALADYDRAIAKEKKEYNLYFAIYEVLVSKDRADKGQEVLKKALKIKGDKVSDKVNKGRIYFLLGENDTAIEMLEEVALKEPEGYYYLFLVYDSMENEDKALENLNAYMEKETDADSYKLYEIGNSLLDKGMYEDAADCYTKALELKKVPNKQGIMRNLVVAYENNRDFAAAKKVMKQYVEDYPEDEEALREYTFLETR